MTTRPEMKSTTGPNQVKHNFKTSADGRLVITETDENEENVSKKKKAKADDFDDLFDSMEGGPMKNRKRKRNSMNDSDLDDDNDDYRPMKYKAGGSGIHRPLSQNKTKSVDIGKDYKSKKASGDVKKKDKLDPYAYVPLQIQSLNKRKRAKSSGQFKNLVKSARRGAQKGQKQQKKHSKK